VSRAFVVKMVFNVRLEAECIGQPDLPWRCETCPGRRSVLLKAEDVYVGVVPIVDIPHVDLHTPIDVVHDLGPIAEGQINSEIGVGEVSLLHEWLVDTEIVVESHRVPAVNLVLPASGSANLKTLQWALTEGVVGDQIEAPFALLSGRLAFESFYIKVLDQALVSGAFKGCTLRRSGWVAPIHVAKPLHIGQEERVDEVFQSWCDIIHYHFLLGRVEGDAPAFGRIEYDLGLHTFRGDVGCVVN